MLDVNLAWEKVADHISVRLVCMVDNEINIISYMVKQVIPLQGPGAIGHSTTKSCWSKLFELKVIEKWTIQGKSSQIFLSKRLCSLYLAPSNAE